MSNTVLASEMMYRPVRPVLRGQEKLIAIQNQGSASVTSASLSTLRFQLPQSDFWLPRTSYFQWDVTISPGVVANDTVSFKRGVWSIIKSVRISVGGNQIEYIDQYSELHQMLFELSAEAGARGDIADDGDSAAIQNPFWTEGVGEVLSTTAITRTYCFKLYSGMLAMNQLVPLYALGAPVQIEIDLQPVAEALYASQGTPSYSIADVKYQVSIHQMPSKYTQSVNQAMAEGSGLEMLFPSFSSHVISATSTSNEALINAKHRQSKFILFGQRLSANLNAVAQRVRFNRDSLTEVQLQFSDGHQYPSQALKYGAPLVMETRKALDKVSMYGDSYDLLRLHHYFTSSAIRERAIIALPLETFLTQEALSGTDTLTRDMVLITRYSATPTAGTTIRSFVAHDIVLFIRPGYQLTLTK